MKLEEVKELIGEENIDSFLEYMIGQTTGIDEEGNIQYYSWDVERYFESNGKKEEDFD